MKPSPRNARALRLIADTGALIQVPQRYGGPEIGVYGDRSHVIGKDIKLSRGNVERMANAGWIEVTDSPENEKPWTRGSTWYRLAPAGRIILQALSEQDFQPRQPDLSADEIKGLLRSWYQTEGWLFLTELMVESRTMDAFSLGWWSGMFLAIGFEIKVTRADFLREIQDSEKRRPAMGLCHQFYYVTPRRLLRPSEIPEGCGLIEFWKAGRLGETQRHVILDAPIREAPPPGWPMTARIALRSLRSYFRRYDFRQGEVVGEDLPHPTFGLEDPDATDLPKSD